MLIRALLAATFVSIFSAGALAAEKTINVVVVTGGHDFDTKAFPNLFADLPDVKVTYAPQKDDSELFEDLSDWTYDVIVFYNMGKKISEKRQANLLKLLDRGVGIVALHHCIAAYPNWDQWARIIGGKYFEKAGEMDGVQFKASTYLHDRDEPIRVEAEHAVTKDVKDFVLHDETYKGQWFDPNNKVLLTTTDETSDKPVAWAKSFAKSRVFYMQLGHGPQAYSDTNYRLLVSNAIHWTAGK